MPPPLGHKNDAVAYDAAFFSQVDGESRRSADVIVPMLIEMFEPRSVVDVGCGLGTWLRAFSDRGVARIRGFDGSDVPGKLVIDAACYSRVDLEIVDSFGSGFDLAVCLEVAEHLSENVEDNFVRKLVRSSGVVVFSAAVPGQPGPGHINLKPLQHWVKRFSECGYDVFDILRPRLWQNQGVAWWYRQNILVFAKRGTAAHRRLLRRGHSPGLPDMFLVSDVVMARLPYLDTPRIAFPGFTRLRNYARRLRLGVAIMRARDIARRVRGTVSFLRGLAKHLPLFLSTSKLWYRTSRKSTPQTIRGVSFVFFSCRKHLEYVNAAIQSLDKVLEPATGANFEIALFMDPREGLLDRSAFAPTKIPLRITKGIAPVTGWKYEGALSQMHSILRLMNDNPAIDTIIKCDSDILFLHGNFVRDILESSAHMGGTNVSTLKGVGCAGLSDEVQGGCYWFRTSALAQGWSPWTWLWTAFDMFRRFPFVTIALFPEDIFFSTVAKAARHRIAHHDLLYPDFKRLKDPTLDTEALTEELAANPKWAVLHFEAHGKYNLLPVWQRLKEGGARESLSLSEGRRPREWSLKQSDPSE